MVQLDSVNGGTTYRVDRRLRRTIVTPGVAKRGRRATTELATPRPVGLVSIAAASRCGDALPSRWHGRRVRRLAGLTQQDQVVVDHFQSRRRDVARCVIDGWCYRTRSSASADVRTGTARLEGASVSAKNELLFAHGINFNEVPV